MGFHSVLKIYKTKELNAFFGKLSPPTNTTTYIVILFSLKICWGKYSSSLKDYSSPSFQQINEISDCVFTAKRPLFLLLEKN